MRTIGIGTLVHDPKIQELTFEDKQARKCSFLLRFKEQDGQNQILKFELWDSAADVLSQKAKEGDTLYIEAIPRSYESKGEPGKYKTVFRVTNFNIIHATKNPTS